MSIRIRVGEPRNLRERPDSFDDRAEPPEILRDDEEPPPDLDPGYQYIPKEEVPAYVTALRRKREQLEREEAGAGSHPRAANE